MTYAPEQETAIAYWTRPQYIDVRGRVQIGVAAYALEGIEKVEFYFEDAEIVPKQLEGDLTFDGKVDVDDLNYILSNWDTTGPIDLVRVLGNWGQEAEGGDSGFLGTATEESLNDQTGELEYWFEFDSTQYEDLERLRICAKVTPTVGVPLYLEGDFQDNKNVCGLDVYPHNKEYVQDPAFYVAASGSDENGNGTRENPFATMSHALWHDRPENISGRHIKLLEGEHSLPANTTDRDLINTNSNGRVMGRWVTIESAVDPELCPIVKSDGIWTCKMHFKNVHITPRNEDDQKDLIRGGSTRVLQWFENCLIEGASRRSGYDMTKSGARIWSISTTWRRQFQPAMRLVDIQSTYDLISGDIMLTSWFNLVSNVLVTNHGRAVDPDNPDEVSSEGVHSDLVQTHTGGNFTDPVLMHNIIMRYVTEWNHNGGQLFFGSYGRNDHPDSHFKNFAVIGCRLGQWAGITEDMTIGGLVSDDVHRARVFAWGPHNTRNCLFQDNFIFGKANWNSGGQSPNIPYDNGYGDPHYVNVKWSRNYRTPEKKEYFMPGPDTPIETKSVKEEVGPAELRFNPKTMSFPWTSPITGIHYDGEFEGFASHGVSDYIPNNDTLDIFDT